MLYDYDYQKDIYERNMCSDICTIWINVPTPFKKGDIVDTNSQYGKGVIYYICNQDEDFVKSAENGEKSDSSDMTCYCLFLDGTQIYWECCHAYDQIEYCENNLEGFERILKAISSLMTNEISVDLCIDTYNYLKAEYEIKKNMSRFGLYTQEGLELAGVGKNKEFKELKEIFG